MEDAMDLSKYLEKETITIEYKDDTKPNFDFGLVVEACVGLANASGGEVLLGIAEDKSNGGRGVVLGSKLAAERTGAAIYGMILEKTIPNLPTQVSFVQDDISGKTIAIIKVEKQNFVVSTSSGRYIKRQLDSHGKPKNAPMTQSEIIRETTLLGMNDLSSIVIPDTKLDDLDLSVVQNLAAKILSETSSEYEKEIFSHSPTDILKSLGLLDDNNRPRLAAILLFGTSKVLLEKVPNHFVQYQVFGNAGEILRNIMMSEAIATLFPKLLKMPELNTNTNEFVMNGRSVVIPEYSQDALREAFANALVHRDYAMHSGVQIQVYPGELRITSAGGFLKGISIDNLLNAVPTPRNRRLADAMRAFKFVETSGRGIDKIYYWQAKYGRSAPDYSATTDSHVVVSLTGGKANMDFIKTFMKYGDAPTIKETLTLNALFYRRSMNAEQITKLLQTSESDALRVLNELLKKDWIEIIDEQNPLYFLKGTIKKARLNSENIDEYKNQVLDLLRENNKISRSDMSKITYLSEVQVYKILKQLETENKIRVEGRRWIVI
jgi:ATP-dependent DNA helicase RecG